MAREKIDPDYVICSNSDCQKIFIRSELEALGDQLVIPEHKNPSTEFLCSGSFEAPIEMVDTEVSNFRKS